MTRRDLQWLALVAGCVASTALGYRLFSRPAPPPAVPVGFRVSPASVELGTLVQGQKATAVVAVACDAGGWVVEQVIPSCGCSVASVSADVLKPGAPVALRVGYNSAGRFGAQTHSVRVVLRSADDPSRREDIVVPVTVDVKKVVWADPDSASLSGCTLGGVYTTRVTLHCAEGHAGVRPPRVAAGAESPEFLVVPRGPLGPGPNELELQFAPERTAGRRVVSVPIDTGLNDHPPVAVSIDAVVPSQFRTDPADVYLGSVRPGGAKTVRVTVSDAPSALEVDHCPEFLTVRVTGAAGRQELDVRLRDDRLTPRTVLRDTIRLKTGSSTEPVLSIGILGVVTDPAAVPPDPPSPKEGGQ